jgi:hypothetical protein
MFAEYGDDLLVAKAGDKLRLGAGRLYDRDLGLDTLV